MKKQDIIFAEDNPWLRTTLKTRLKEKFGEQGVHIKEDGTIMIFGNYSNCSNSKYMKKIHLYNLIEKYSNWFDNSTHENEVLEVIKQFYKALLEIPTFKDDGGEYLSQVDIQCRLVTCRREITEGFEQQRYRFVCHSLMGWVHYDFVFYESCRHELMEIFEKYIN